MNYLKENGIARIDKKRQNIKITMKDLSCFTAITNIEYALFERPDKYIILGGTSRNIKIDNKLVTEIRKGKYKWIGHTHPGVTKLCLQASENDYQALAILGQKSSAIYNSKGDHEIFGWEDII